MKVLVITVLCALAGSVRGGAVVWPHSAVAVQPPVRVLNTIIPAQTKAFGYSTAQYINTLPPSYSYGLQPQFAYQVPHLSGISSIPSAYYPVSDLSYYPASIFYPTVGSVVPGVPSSPIVPVAPAAPAVPSPPSQPPSSPSEQPAGDADTTVIESADTASEQQRQQQVTASQMQTGPTPLPPANTFPNFPFPQFPQGSGLPFPQIPQLPQFTPPQFPQLPQLPSNPLSPQSPAESTPSTFPASIDGDKGLNDEDTISVDSA